MSATGTALRVLLVDDEPMMRSLVRLMLDRTDRYTVVGEAGDGRQAIEAACSVRPDVVLLDLSMPRMDGLEALPHLRERAPEAIVVVLSGFTTEGAAPKAHEAGAAGYLEKGLGPGELIAALDELTGSEGTAPATPNPTRPQPSHDHQAPDARTEDHTDSDDPSPEQRPAPDALPKSGPTPRREQRGHLDSVTRSRSRGLQSTCRRQGGPWPTATERPSSGPVNARSSGY